MRWPITVLFLSIVVPSASASITCAAIESTVWYPQLKAMPFSDKAMHCALSCHLANKCSVLDSYTFGRVKEFIDVFGPGNAEWTDLEANDDGILMSIAGRARNIRECIRECRTIYPGPPQQSEGLSHAVL